MQPIKPIKCCVQGPLYLLPVASTMSQHPNNNSDKCDYQIELQLDSLKMAPQLTALHFPKPGESVQYINRATSPKLTRFGPRGCKCTGGTACCSFSGGTRTGPIFSEGSEQRQRRWVLTWMMALSPIPADVQRKHWGGKCTKRERKNKSEPSTGCFTINIEWHCLCRKNIITIHLRGFTIFLLLCSFKDLSEASKNRWSSGLEANFANRRQTVSAAPLVDLIPGQTDEFF